MAARVKLDEQSNTVKYRYQVRNWAAYDRALVNCGSLTVWFDEESIAKGWTPPPPKGRVEPKVFFVEMAEQTIARVGVMTAPNGEAANDRYIEIMRQATTSKGVDVSVYIREATERDTMHVADASIVMFHRMGKAFEATITCRRCNDRPALQTAEFGISQLHPRGCTTARH